MVAFHIAWRANRRAPAFCDEDRRLLRVSRRRRVRRRRFGRRTWFLYALSLLPLPPSLYLLVPAAHRQRRFCTATAGDEIMAALCVVLAVYLLVHLAVFAASIARGQTPATARQLQTLGIAIAVGIAAYVSLALQFWEGLCL